MQHHLFEQIYRVARGVCLATLLSLSVAGCVSGGGSMESAYQANLASETALNAQIMSDRARDQRCRRDPSRAECGRR
jgi:hypothetical protein